MNSLNNALQGKIQPGLDPKTHKPAVNPTTGKPYTSAEIAQGWVDYNNGKVGGAWWVIAFDAASTANKLPFVGKPLGPTAEEAAAVFMAEAHINFDLRLALLSEGPGTDATWACIGNVVKNAAKKQGGRLFLYTFMGTSLSDLAGVGNIDPLLMRNNMRLGVQQILQEQQNQGNYTPDPFRGIPLGR